MAALGQAGCAIPSAAPCPPAPPAGLVGWVIDYGWHTEIVLPASRATGALGRIGEGFPGARALSFGFGKFTFMTLPDPGLFDFVSGAVPGPGTVRVIGLAAEPGARRSGAITRLDLTPQAMAALVAFLAASIAQDAAGRPIVLADAPQDRARFYASVPGYSLAYTCNAWTADGLRQSGMGVEQPVLFASGVMAALARTPGACTPLR